MKDLREYAGKKLLSFIRQGDYSHAGEDAAIDIVLGNCNIQNHQSVLDIGCGLGGTANYIQNKYQCSVVGFDIEPEAVEYSKSKYKNVNFYTSDVVYIGEKIKNITFDFMCAFNSFYAFSDQVSALQSLRKLAHDNTTLAIFDYSDISQNQQTNPLSRMESDMHSSFTPINQNTIGKTLMDNGWKLEKTVDVSSNYQQWYAELLDKLYSNKDKIFNEYGSDVFTKAETTYKSIHQSLTDKTSGGIIIYAKSN